MKILVVRYRFIGDMILTIPFLRNLRYAYPNAQIDMLVSPNSGEVIENCPYVNNFIYFDTTRKHKYEIGEGKKKSFWHYVKLLHREKYDKAYVLKRSLSSAMLCYFAGIKERIGYDCENRGFLLTKKIKYDTQKHESECFLDVLKADNIFIKDNYLENWVSEYNNQKADELFKLNNINNEHIKAVVSVTASDDRKVWNINNYARIIEYLSNEKGVQVIYIGAPSDKAIYDTLQIKENLKIPAVNLCEKVTLKDSLAVLKKVDFIVGNDSGTLHMASSVGTKVIGLYGPMPAEKWRAIGDDNIIIKSDLECIPCSLRGKCKNNIACMENITIEQVKSAIDTVLNKRFSRV